MRIATTREKTSVAVKNSLRPVIFRFSDSDRAYFITRIGIPYDGNHDKLLKTQFLSKSLSDLRSLSNPLQI